MAFIVPNGSVLSIKIYALQGKLKLNFNGQVVYEESNIQISQDKPIQAYLTVLNTGNHKLIMTALSFNGNNYNTRYLIEVVTNNQQQLPIFSSWFKHENDDPIIPAEGKELNFQAQ